MLQAEGSTATSPYGSRRGPEIRHARDITSTPQPAQHRRTRLQPPELIEGFVARASPPSPGTSSFVLVNPGSSDRTAELLDQIATADPRVR